MPESAGNKLVGFMRGMVKPSSSATKTQNHTDIELVDLIGKLSHELRSPLSGVIGFAEVLKESKPSDERYAHYVSLIHNSGVSMLGMIDSAVIYARTRTDRLELKPERCDLAAMVDRVVERALSGTTSPSQVTVDWSGSREFTVSRERFEAVLFRIVDNAVRFGAGKPVSVSGVVAEGSPRRLELSVMDRGIGMTSEDAAAALVPLGKLKAKPKGNHSGARMSLAIVREFARACGGIFSLSSDLGEGTRATLIIEEIG